MADFSTELNKITNAPQKVQLMYRAVAEFIREKRNITTLKVEDITKRAGIGKGTAYEYFSSKEELISCALVYEYAHKFMYLAENVKKVDGFETRFHTVLAWLYENREYNVMFVKIINLISQKTEEGDGIKLQLSPELLEGIRDRVLDLICILLNQGLAENIITEQDERKRILAFLTAIVEYNFSLGARAGNCCFFMDDSEMRQFVYSSMVKALN